MCPPLKEKDGGGGRKGRKKNEKERSGGRRRVWVRYDNKTCVDCRARSHILVATVVVHGAPDR